MTVAPSKVSGDTLYNLTLHFLVPSSTSPIDLQTDLSDLFYLFYTTLLDTKTRNDPDLAYAECMAHQDRA